MIKKAASILMLLACPALATLEDGSPITLNITFEDEDLSTTKQYLKVMVRPYDSPSTEVLAATDQIDLFATKTQKLDSQLRFDHPMVNPQNKAQNIQRAQHKGVEFMIEITGLGNKYAVFPCTWSENTPPTPYELVKDHQHFNIVVKGTGPSTWQCILK